MGRKKRNSVIEEFYDIHNGINELLGVIPKAKENRLKRLRSELVVDFYNLQLPSNQDYLKTMNVEEIFQKYGDQLEPFIDKYLPYHKKVKTSSANIIPSADKMFMTMLLYEHEIFNKIVDKAISGKKMEDSELKYIANNIYAEIVQAEDHGIWRLYYSLDPMDCVIYRALFSWIISLTQGAENVKRCEEPTCKKLYIPTARGHEQKYCKNSCKMKSFRRLNKKVLLDKSKY